jgi:hypothetical protein
MAGASAAVRRWDRSSENGSHLRPPAWALLWLAGARLRVLEVADAEARGVAAVIVCAVKIGEGSKAEDGGGALAIGGAGAAGRDDISAARSPTDALPAQHGERDRPATKPPLARARAPPLEAA